MNLRTTALYSIFLILSFFDFEPVYAQKSNTDSIAAARKQYYDSIKIARQHTTDSIKAVRQHASDSMARIRKYKESKRYTDSVAKQRKVKTDSIQAVRKHFTDSLQTTRKQRTDSLNAIRKYRESKRYTDSVAKARKAKTEVIQVARQKILDSTTTARKKLTDSTIAIRKAVTDSMRTSQKKRTDSMATIRKYRESKRYQDSVAIVRKDRLDSLKAVRKIFNDSVASVRKQKSDSMMAVRKAITDSTTAARTKYSDSLKDFRKARTDSLAKIKEKRSKDQKARAKTKAEKQQLAFEMKLNKKRQAWSNEKMLKKKWGISRQIVQNTFTRYNYYFNTDKKMDEAIDNMLRAQNENYDSLIALFPFDPDRDSSLLSADMDSIIQKASIGIQLHDPRTKWGDDLYLLMGQAYYYKADYDNASTTFRYALSLRDKKKKKSSGNTGYSQQSKSKDGKKTTSIVQADNKGLLDFAKHRSVHNEALLWLARTYTEWHQDGNAESVLDILENDADFPKSLQGRLALERAYLNMSQGNYPAAKENLAVVADDKQLPDWLRIRAAYINGQLHQERGEYAEAAKYFEKVVDLNPKIDMDFYARKNLAYSQMYSGVDQDKALASLKRVLKDGKYNSYYEQVYFVMGRLAAQSGKNEDAIEYLKNGLQSPKTTKKQKAVSFATLGDVYYNMRNYEDAKNYYDSASLVASAAPNDSSVLMAVRRSKVLDEVTRPSRIIHIQDSLLDLAAMSNKDQRSVVRRYIRSLETARADSIFRAENGGMNTPSDNTSSAQTGGSWYFGNPALVQQGINEFKRKWGTRTNADNWRRSAALASNSGKTNTPTNIPTDATDVDEDAVQLDENGIPTEESLLAQIPNSQIRKDDALNRIRRAYVDLGGAYIKQLEDYPQAIRTLDTFDKRFPANEHMAEVLYLRYLAAVKQNNMTEAKLHADNLLRDYGNTSWAALVRPTEDGAGLQNNDNIANKKVDEYYDQTYDLLIQRQFNQTLQMSRDGQRLYSKEVPYVKRFRVIEAFSLAGSGDYNGADTIARGFIKQNPGDTLIPWAEAVLAYSKNNRPDVMPTPPPKPSAADTSKATTTPSAADDVVDRLPNTAPPAPPSSLPSEAPLPAQYTYTPKEPHYAIIYLPSTDQRSNALKAAITDFNTFKFSSLNLKADISKLVDTKSLIVNKSFETALQAKIYMNMLRNTPDVFKQYSSDEYEVVIISEENHRKLMADKDMDAYMKFYRLKYK